MIDDFVKEITELRCENSNLEYKLEKLLKENQTLKEELEDMTLCRDIASGHRQEVQDRETLLLRYQERFIKYLEDKINKTDYEVNILGNSLYLAWSNAYKEILQKYKEIIEGNKKWN